MRYHLVVGVALYLRRDIDGSSGNTPRQNLTFMRLGVRTSERRCAGVTRASATSGLRWVDCERKEH